MIEAIQAQLGSMITALIDANNEITIEITPANLIHVMKTLRDHDAFQFDGLMDVCGVDYAKYGVSEWTTNKATGTGFDRGVNRSGSPEVVWDKPRFAVVYHLLSYALNQRLRVRVLIEGEPPIIESVNDLWPAANWFEREAFDLYGILFNSHPDLRRILTDYGFIGHPFRKDFPLSGTVEVRYDAAQQRVVYEPVDIVPRVLVPKVIRQDNRYESHE